VNSIPAPPRQLGLVLSHIRSGGLALVPTYLTCTVIDAKCLAKWDQAGIPLLREDGDGYRLARGRKSVYLLPGQLKLA
jgi:hypothetical protein